MRRIIFAAAVIFALLAAGEASAQRIANGEKIPKFKAEHWLEDIIPEDADYTYIEFIRSSSMPCIESCHKMKRHADNSERPMRMIFITREEPCRIHHSIRECIGRYAGVLIDDSGRIFEEFGIQYVPFGVIIDRKRHAIWFGNPLTTDNAYLKKIIEEE